MRKQRCRSAPLFFAIRIVQSLYYLNPKYQASNHLLSQYSLVCVGPGRKPQRPVFSQRGSYRNCKDPKFLDRQALANSVDPDQTAPTLFAIPSAPFGQNSLLFEF